MPNATKTLHTFEMEYLLLKRNYRDKPSEELAQKMALLQAEMQQAIETVEDPRLRKDYIHALRRMEVGWGFLGQAPIKADPPLLRLDPSWGSDY
jgi:hypothetical protein